MDEEESGINAQYSARGNRRCAWSRALNSQLYMHRMSEDRLHIVPRAVIRFGTRQKYPSNGCLE